jgi:hypothetical protein
VVVASSNLFLGRIRWCRRNYEACGL